MVRVRRSAAAQCEQTHPETEPQGGCAMPTILSFLWRNLPEGWERRQPWTAKATSAETKSHFY